MLSLLERLPVFCPVVVLVETDLSVLLSVFALHGNAQVFAEAFADLLDRDLVFPCQRLDQGEAKDILDSDEPSPIVSEPIVVLYSAIDCAIPRYDLIGIESAPAFSVQGLSLCCTKTLVLESLNEFGERGVHLRFPSGAAAFKPFSRVVRREDDFLSLAFSDGEAGAQQMRFFRFGVGDGRLFLAQPKFKRLAEKLLDSPFDLLGEVVTPTKPDGPVVCITQVLDPDLVRVIDFHRWKSTDALDEFSKLPGFGVSFGGELPLAVGQALIGARGSLVVAFFQFAS